MSPASVSKIIQKEIRVGIMKTYLPFKFCNILINLTLWIVLELKWPKIGTIILIRRFLLKRRIFLYIHFPIDEPCMTWLHDAIVYLI